MSVSKLPSGRWRAQIYNPRLGRNVSAAKILGGPGSYRTKTEAKQARSDARARLQGTPIPGVTVSQFRDRWTTEPLFARPKQSTNLHNAERTKAFAAKYGAMPITSVTDLTVSEWLGHGGAATVPALRAMFNDAMSARGGRLIDRNPFAQLGLHKSTGNRHKQPPSEETVWALIRNARRVSGPHYAAWLQVAAFTGMRPGELDALRWDHINFGTDTIRVTEQYNRATRTFTTPKNGRARDAPLTPPARDALLTLPRSSAFCFLNLQGGHMTPSSRVYHWKAAAAAAGWTGSPYLATRHFAGWYMTNVLGLAAEDVAIALGHTDGGYLVRNLYGHQDHALALDRVRAAYASTANVTPLKIAQRKKAG